MGRPIHVTRTVRRSRVFRHGLSPLPLQDAPCLRLGRNLRLGSTRTSVEGKPGRVGVGDAPQEVTIAPRFSTRVSSVCSPETAC